jgi:hypothetical protein
MKLVQLSDLAERHGSDKGWNGPTRTWSANNYVDVYQAYLHDRREEPLSLLEVGLGVTGPNYETNIVKGRNTGGASMKMWRDYLPNAAITGADINPAPYLNSDRVTTYVVDQGSRDSLRQFLKQHPDPSFDVIIDDGSHRADHQQITLEALFPFLKPGGIYFVEDLNDFGFGGRSGNNPYATPDTISTRDFFKRFGRTGEIAKPNAFQSTDFLQSVADIAFYCPRPVQRPRDIFWEIVRTVAARAHRGLMRVEWVPESEKLLALRKLR